MKFDQDLCLNLQYDFGKMNSTLGSVVPLAMFYDYGPHANIPIIFNRPPEIVITAEVAEVVSEVVQLVFDPVRVGVKSVWHLKANHPHLD